MLEQAVHIEADLIVIDLDDLVAPEHKAKARLNAIKALREIDWKSRTKAIRMNALNTPYAYLDLTEVVRGAGRGLELLLVPKVDRAEDVQFIDSLLTQLEKDQHLSHQIQLELQIETALGLSNVTEVASASFRTKALVFGPGDYAASMNFPIQADNETNSQNSTLANSRWQFALHQIAIAARAAGLRIIDGPYGDINDRDGFVRSCQEAHTLGCDGKWCLDLNQVAIANEIFLPTSAQINYAEEIFSVYEEATASQQSSVFLRGKLIDLASLKSAHNTLNKARQAGLL
jgi:citrate lyase subunit beta/citryl-CoA lyase